MSWNFSFSLFPAPVSMRISPDSCSMSRQRMPSWMRLRSSGWTRRPHSGLGTMPADDRHLIVPGERIEIASWKMRQETPRELHCAEPVAAQAASRGAEQLRGQEAPVEANVLGNEDAALERLVNPFGDIRKRRR